MDGSGPKTPLIAQDTAVALAAIVAGSGLSWWWLATAGAMPMASGAGIESMPGMGWSPAYAFSMFVMWSIMMVAMMLPSATPMILLHARTAKDNRFATAAFAGSYLAVWTAFSALATGVQWLLSDAGWLSDAMRLQNRTFAAAVLAGAGLYQLTPLKQLCLSHCRSPLAFLMHNWRPGIDGAVRMGLSHGAYCVGCCWFIMALLFVGGVMNLVLVVALAAFVMAERLFPFGDRVGRVAGIVALTLAALMLAGAV